MYAHAEKKETIKKTTTVVPSRKSSLDNESGLKHGFGAKKSLPLTQNTPAVFYDTPDIYL